MPKRLDLYGKVFGEWKVGRYLGSSLWECKCSCGVTKPVLGKTLVSGKSKSCGHSTNKIIDLKGRQFGKWKVLDYYEDGNWRCLCDCGNIKVVSGYDLRNNKSNDCGHSRYENLSLRNKETRVKLEGTQQNDWEVLRYLGNKKYQCRCSCGNIRNVATHDLISGNSKSCGHNNGVHRVNNLVGKKFGYLTIEEYTGNKQWICKCICGNTTVVTTGNLRNGSTRSCGCKQYNRLEKEDIILAINNHISIYGEKPFIHDLSVSLDRHEGNINRYVNKYDLRSQINSEYGSRAEREVFRLMDQGILHDRQVLKGKELDIYYPDIKFAIEFNGTYWHSTEYKDKYYHQKKTIECAKKGIQLMHIFEYEWNDEVKKKKLIELIKKKFTRGNVVYARKTVVKVIDKELSKQFLNSYHLQNYTQSEIDIGCYYDNTLVGVMTFGRPRFNSNYEYEIIRLAWKDDISVVGGTEKMFKYFLRKYRPKSIITYCDISKFTGNVYTKLGFKVSKDSITEPNYVWVNTLDNIVLKRYQTMKHKLIENGYGGIGDTEDEIMSRLGYFKVYDSGNLRLLLDNIQYDN